MGTQFLGILGFKYSKIYEKRVQVVSGWPEFSSKLGTNF